MREHSGQSQELALLLERWCEDRLSAADMVRLEALVLADDEAMRRYLAYVQLHGTLHWDTAVAEEPRSNDVCGIQTGRRIASSARHDERLSQNARRRSINVAVSACLLAVAAMGLWTASRFGRPADPVVAENEHAGGREIPIASRPPEESPVRPVPRLSLDSEPSVTDPPVADEGPEGSIAMAPPAPPAPKRTESDDGDVVAFIDRELGESWEENGVSPSPVTDDATWLRRASLDLTGRIPSLDAIDRFEQERSPNKRANFVDRVLSDGEFAQHFTTVWANQLVGRSTRTAHERHALQRFLLEQFQQNRPWNEIVAEIVAAEGGADENGAAGFLLAHLNNQAVPATAITARLFLGLQVQCTQCHKHPWNEWSQEQFWSLNAFFKQAKIHRRETADAPNGRKHYEAVLSNDPVGGPTFYEDRRGVMQATQPKYGDVPVDPGPQINRRRELAELMSASDDAQLARAFVNRMWSRFFGYGFTNPVDDMGPHNPPSHPELLERLTREFVAGGYDVRQLVRWITSCRAYHLSSRLTGGNAFDHPEAGDPPLFSRMPLKTFTPGQVYDSLQVATRGEPAAELAYFERADDRDEWVGQFFESLDNEENSEVSTFGESLTQALAMMNGPLLRAALEAEPGTVLHQVLVDRMDDDERIRRLCRAALARDPSPQELDRFRRILGQAKSSRNDDPRAAVNEVLRDVFWAYLNSSEFVTNR